MKQYDVERIRTVALVSHGGAGKTTLAEAMLFHAGAVERMGRVDEGTSALDFEPEEVRRHITISTAFHRLRWKECSVILVDTPGDANFLADTRNGLVAVEGALLLVDATSGVQVQTERVWSYLRERNIPCIGVINKLDRERADWREALQQMQDVLQAKAFALQLPLGQESSFQGVVDLLSGQAWSFEEGKPSPVEVPPQLREAVDAERERLLETLAEVDDEIMEKYLEGEELGLEELRRTLRAGMRTQGLVPVVACSGLRSVGIQPLLDALIEYLPSPVERSPMEGTDPRSGEPVKRACSPQEPFSAFVFKTIADPYAGRLNVLKVCSGLLNANSTVHNSTKGVQEKVGQVLQLEGKAQRAVEVAVAGEIVALAKLRETTTGDTLCDERHPVVFPALSLPNPVLSVAVSPRRREDEDKMATCLQRLMEEDPTLRMHRDEETKEVILSGMGQIHLEVTLEKLRRKFGLEVELKTPKVPYRETIRSSTRVQGKYKKQTGGRGQYGDTWLELEPLPRGAGFQFEDRIVGGVVPRQYIPAVEKGIVEAMREGVLAGYPVTDLKVTLVDGSHHPVDSSELAFKIAASMGFKKGMAQADPVLLEPIMNLEVVVPDDCLGDVIGDLNGRRGRVLGGEPHGRGMQVVRAQVPMAEVLRYASELTSITGGRGSFSMDFSHYEEVPPHLAEKIIAQSKKSER